MHMETRERAQEFLGRYAEALNAPDAEALAACWQVPALALSDESAHAFESPDEVRAFLASSNDRRLEQGTAATVPTSINVAELSPRILRVDVVWSHRDAAGTERSRRYTYYLLHLDADGRPGIRVAVDAPAPPG
jgi:hypothetical protein